MKVKSNFFLTIFLVLILTISGCSLTGGGSSSSSKTDQTGKGLEIDFDIDDQWIHNRQLIYEIALKNTGKNEVELRSSDMVLTTNIIDASGSSVFEQDSLSKMKSTIFQTDPLVLYHDQEIDGIGGNLYLSEDFFKNKNNEEVEYTLKFTYDYKTDFANNLEIDTSSNNIMKITDKVAQAAPVEIVDIEMTPYGQDEYIIKYYFRDNGPASDKYSVKIDSSNFDIQFRNSQLSSSSCRALVETTVAGETQYKDIGTDNMILNQNTREIIYACRVSLSDIEGQGPVTTTTFGSFTYTYSVSEKGTIRLPNNRDAEIDWS